MQRHRPPCEKCAPVNFLRLTGAACFPSLTYCSCRILPTDSFQLHLTSEFSATSSGVKVNGIQNIREEKCGSKSLWADSTNCLTVSFDVFIVFFLRGMLAQLEKLTT